MNLKDTPRSLRSFAFLTLFCLSALCSSVQAQDPRTDAAYQKGATLFKAQCTSCHQVHKKVVGPALAGVYDKYSKEWLYSWVKNSQAMVKAGDPQAVAIFNEYNKSVMTAFALSNEEIDAILAYVKVEAEVPVAAAVPAAGTAEVAEKKSFFSAPMLGLLVLILLTVVLMLSGVTDSLSRLLREKAGEIVPEPISWASKLFSRKTAALGVLGLVILTGYSMVDNAMNLGRQQGYTPSQPIKFSHKLHAGTNQIPCQYCHSGANSGKSAIIPSASVCMNCHKAVKEGPTYGTKEISKIYAAIGWDPEKNAYIPGYEQKEIEWVRIHNLPDHVYFNHAQHVNAGGVECQKCHGKVEEQEVLGQHASLGMGWCVNCHRQTDVKFQSNDYYQTYEKYHEDLKSGKIKSVTVDDIGGTECQKCHY